MNCSKIPEFGGKSGPGSARKFNTNGQEKSKSKNHSQTIALNKRARHDYFVEDRYEAGLCLHGWEVKSMRDGRVQLNESYVVVKTEKPGSSACTYPR